MYNLSDEERRIYESLSIPIALFQYIDEKPIILLVSDGFCNLKNIKRDELFPFMTANMFGFVHPDDAVNLLRAGEAFARRESPFDIIYRSRINGDSEYHTFHSMGNWQTMADGTEVAFVQFNDMTNGMHKVSKMTEEYEIFSKDQFYCDHVTGLKNVRYFQEHGEEFANEIRSVKAVPMLIYTDVVSMQSYNRQFGYTKGDDLLKLIADILKDLFPDALIVRGNDDHFILLTKYMDEQFLYPVFETINYKIKTQAFGTTSGIQSGVCSMAKGVDTVEALGRAKYVLKEIANNLNKTFCIYTYETYEKYWQQRYIIETFDEALEKGWIKIYYQCIMNIKTGNACYLEALARWVDPERGIFTPAMFIPVLEKHHLLHKLDLYMVEQMCKEVELRRGINLPLLPVSINFSAQDFDYVDIVPAINNILEKYNVPKKRLVIELTEQDVAKATDKFKKQIKEIRDNGYKLWIDDFGSGYSSLNVFSQFEFDLVKFDLELLRNLEANNGANRLILKAMVDVAKKLGLQTLAEGMENEEHLQFLEEIGCEMAQGYYFYTPESFEYIDFKLKSGNPMIGCDYVDELDMFTEPADKKER